LIIIPLSRQNFLSCSIAPSAQLSPYEECIIELHKKRCNEKDVCIVDCLANGKDGRDLESGILGIGGGCSHYCFAYDEELPDNPPGEENCREETIEQERKFWRDRGIIINDAYMDWMGREGI